MILGTGWGEAINGGFLLVLDGTEQAVRRARRMLSWDVNHGVSRESDRSYPFLLTRENVRSLVVHGPVMRTPNSKFEPLWSRNPSYESLFLTRPRSIWLRRLSQSQHQIAVDAR